MAFDSQHMDKDSIFMQHSITLRKIIFIILFTLFITPYSISIGGQGVSVNYLFIFLPLLVFLLTGRINWPRGNVIVYMAVFVCIFIIASIYQVEYIDYLIRRFASFLIFMSMFAFLFLKIDLDMVQSFKSAIVFYSIYSIVMTITEYWGLGGSELGAYAKGLVGSQRIGFIYIMALWILFFTKERTVLFTILKYVGVGIIVVGLLLTFSRTSVFALISSVGVYFAMATIEHIRNYKSFRHTLYRLFLIITHLIVLIILLVNVFPNTIQQYKNTIYQYSTATVASSKEQLQMNEYLDWQQNKSRNNIDISDNSSEQSLVMRDAQNKGTSVGYRIYMMGKVLNTVVENPLTGSGFLGVWSMFENREGSAHSQYLDVLFRLGIVGFLVYTFILYKILRFLYRKDTGMFFGFVGMLFYGIFHETFKLSQGAFILAFLLAMYEQRRHYFKGWKNSS